MNAGSAEMNDGQTIDLNKLPSATRGLTQPLELVSTSGKHVVGNLQGIMFHGAFSASSYGRDVGPRSGVPSRRRTGI
ncbi:hypothetical protein BCY84_12232 [Trypanosoma cruzi cruzi]|nr:hypothetical protein TcBrA4_0097480 [Trypanosoma cruzi]PBJ74861.1 hypothetical protein BCY84_12232 [Trypanosoma cruzi cruzi]